MDKTLIDYDKNLEELEKQREKLQKVMQMMGQEWEESGAGIGWLGQVDLPIGGNTSSSNLSETTTDDNTVIKETPLSELTTTNKDALNISNQPLFTNILSAQSGPSPEYLQSLLNVNEALLAQSLATPIPQPTTTATPPMLTPSEEQYSVNSPLITPNDTPSQPDCVDPEFIQPFTNNNTIQY